MFISQQFQNSRDFQGRRERVRASVKKKCFASPLPPINKGGPAKNMYTKSERLTQFQSDLGFV